MFYLGTRGTSGFRCIQDRREIPDAQLVDRKDRSGTHLPGSAGATLTYAPNSLHA